MASKKNPVVAVDRFDELNAALRKIGDRATGLALERAAEAGAEVIVEETRRLAPRKSGALAEGVHAKKGRIQQGRAQFSISYNARQWYGALMERGTKFIAARPFLRPGLEASIGKAQDAVSKSLRESLRDVLS